MYLHADVFFLMLYEWLNVARIRRIVLFAYSAYCLPRLCRYVLTSAHTSGHWCVCAWWYTLKPWLPAVSYANSNAKIVEYQAAECAARTHSLTMHGSKLAIGIRRSSV